MPMYSPRAHDIDTWANRSKAREEFAALLRTLVHSTGAGAKLAMVDFPAFDNSQRQGWDGQVTAEQATPWIPAGKSGWEFGCDKKPKPKADNDYRTRTDGVPVEERESMTFVFVTPRNWHGKGKWEEDKKKCNEWKDVRAFDASDLEQWLEQSAPAQARFREFQGGTGREIATLDKIWREWSEVTEPKLPKELFDPAVKQHQKNFKEWLETGAHKPFVVAADSPLEALAFLSCALDELGKSCPGSYERSIVIRSPEALETVSKPPSNLIAIIASAEVEKSMADLWRGTHTIVIRGHNRVNYEVDIALGLLSHESFSKALHHCGFKKSRIDQLTRESACSPTILRRRLAQIPALKEPPWAADHSVARELIPLMFVGAWDSSVEADREIMECLTGKSCEETEQTITKLQTIDEPPVWSVGHFRGVVSKIDMLYAVHQFFTKKDLEDFLFATEIVLSEEDPALELPWSEQWAANLHGKSREHSSALRKGLCDTLVLLAVHGDELVGKRLEINLKVRVDCIVRRLLSPSTKSTWLSHKNELPQYAEAAPDIFLDILENDLDSQEPQVAVLFPSGMGVLGVFGSCPRSGLLWALELLAWEPKYLTRTISILAKMCVWEINDNYVGTPMRTLQVIFWFSIHQTAASLDQRNQVLERLTEKFPAVGWQVCIDRFKPHSSILYFSARPRWRTANDMDKALTKDEMRKVAYKTIELVLGWQNHDERTLGDLIECLGTLDTESRNQIWELVSTWNDAGLTDAKKAKLREQIRRSILMRRSRRCNIMDAERQRAQEVYVLLEPKHPVLRHQWLFQNHSVYEWSSEMEDQQLDYRKVEKHIAHKRRDALREIWDKSGLNGVKQLWQSGDAIHQIGWHMAEILAGVEPAVDFLRKIMIGQSNDLDLAGEHCINGFLAKLELQDRDTILAKLLVLFGSDEDSCIRLLCCSPRDSGTWQHVDRLGRDLKQRYWKQVTITPMYRHESSETITLVDELLAVNRPQDAFFAAHLNWEHLDSPRLIRLLKEVVSCKSDVSRFGVFHSHCISKAFDMLEQRRDTPYQELIYLEFLFIGALHGSRTRIQNLERQLAVSPEFFAQMVALAFPDNGGGESLVNQRRSYELLTEASRIPGTKDDGSINGKELTVWLEQVRALTKQCGQKEEGDLMIGHLLSHCPSGNDDVWPCEPVREAINDIRSQEIIEGVSSGVSNAHALTWQCRGEGSKQERKLAEQYRSWSKKVDFEYPFTARMLRQIAARYNGYAKLWDHQDNVHQRIGY